MLLRIGKQISVNINIIQKIVSIFAVIFILSLISNPIYATTYYVDATDGLDTNTGTATDQAWKTISKVNGSTFNAGDTISFKRGETWREQLVIPSSGSVGSPITFNAYGSGDKPKIFGSSLVSNWVNDDIGSGSGDLFNESFESTKPTNSGYDNSGWSETVGSGSVFDTDSTEVSRPSGGGDQLLKIQKVASNYNSLSSVNMSSDNSIVYTTVYFQYDTYSLVEGEMISIAEMRDSAGTLAWRLYFKYISTAPNTRINLRYYNNGSDSNWSTDSTTDIVADTWYKLEVKYDVTNKTFEWRINGTTKGSGSLTGTLPLGCKNIKVGDFYTSKTATYYIDNLRVDSSGYSEDSVVLPENVWRADLATAPKQVWFSKSSVGHWGDPESSLVALTSEYDWYANGGKLFVYSTTDPDTTYDWIEATQRDTGVTTAGSGNISYITIDNLDVRYVAKHGIKTDYLASNWIISNNDISYVSLQHDTYADGIYVNASDTTVSDNTIHDAGDHGIYVLSNYSSGTVEDVIVEDNIVYDCYHTGIDVMNLSGTLQNVTVRRNKYYNTSNYDTTWTNRGILVSTGSGYYTDSVNIYNNIVYNICDTGIQVGGTPGNESNIGIFNNTVYERLSSCSSGTWGYILNSTMNSGVNKFVNNIGALTLATSGSEVVVVTDSSKLSTFNNNIYYRLGGTGTTTAFVNSVGYSNQTTYRSALNPQESATQFVNPLFLDTSAYDFRLQALSTAIDTGFDMSSLFTTDYTGTVRPQGDAFDMGAYEYANLSVTINQAVGQSDPTGSSPINYTVVFSESVSDFATGDVTLSGSAGATTGTVTGSGTTYNVAVSGMTGSGTVIASIGAGVATGESENTNDASTSTDNTVTYDVTAPTLTSISIADTSGYISSSTPTINIVSSGSPSHVAFSCNGGTNWSSWIAYSDAISSFNITNGATGCSSSNGSKTITAKLKDSLGNESSTTNDTTYYDTTAPTGGSVTYTDGLYTSESISLTVSDGTDGSGSGINTSSRIVQRKSATLTDGTCGSFGSYSTISPSGTYPDLTDTTVSSGNCYQYRYLVSDIVDNQVEYATTNVAKVYVPISGDVEILFTTTTSITNTGATITWDTDRESSSQVVYGLSTTYGSSTEEINISPRVTSHTITLSSLVPCSIYHYRVISIDSEDNEGYGNDKSFTTTGCTGSATVISQAPSQITKSLGGSFSLLSNGTGITLTIPSSFSSTDANFQIKQLEEGAVLEATDEPSGRDLIGSYIYDIKALRDVSNTISSFLKPISVTMKYTDSSIYGMKESTLKIYRWNGSEWSVLSSCTNDLINNKVTCTTTHFSVFGLFGEYIQSSNIDSGTTDNGSENNDNEDIEEDTEDKEQNDNQDNENNQSNTIDGEKENNNSNTILLITCVVLLLIFGSVLIILVKKKNSEEEYLDDFRHV